MTIFACCEYPFEKSYFLSCIFSHSLFAKFCNGFSSQIRIKLTLIVVATPAKAVTEITKMLYTGSGGVTVLDAKVQGSCVAVLSSKIKRQIRQNR